MTTVIVRACLRDGHGGSPTTVVVGEDTPPVAVTATFDNGRVEVGGACRT